MSHLKIRRVPLSELEPVRTAHELTPRQKAMIERDAEIRRALNEAAVLPQAMAIVVDLRDGQKLATMRAAVNRILTDEPRDLNFGVRGTSLVFSRGEIPGGRGRARQKQAEQIGQF